MQNKRRLGNEKEELAAGYLKEHGVILLAKNFYFRGGELDLVAKDGEYICFIEVKYRKNAAFGYPEESVSPVKKRNILHGARLFLYQNHFPEETPCRFDVIAIMNDEIKWIKDAFGM